ncbi:TPA: HlyD family secretion protein, partial [Legionella pneumophila]|nr:HlyD family secretion protein [Legionella pneumophila]
FSEKNRYKLVYKVKADLSQGLRDLLKIGQPVEVNYE